MMMAQPAEVMVAYLVLRGLGIRPDASQTDWQVFKSFSPDRPDNTIVCSNTTPVVQGKTMDGVTEIKPAVQFRIRCVTSDSGWQKCQEIIGQLSSARRVSLTCNTDGGDDTEDVRLDSVTVLDGPRQWLAQEEANRRETFTFTVQITAQEV